MAGSAKRTSARALLEDLPSTLRFESVPKLLPEALWSTHESRSAAAVTVEQAGVIVQACDAGEPSTLPASSTARTRNSCAPSASPEYVFGDAQAAHAPASSEHSNVEPASSALKVNVALVADVLAGGAPPPSVVCGAVVSGSIVHVRTAGVASTLPAASVARTRSSRAPSDSPVYVFGELQAANAAPSSEHSNVEPGSLEDSVNVALRDVVVVAGPPAIDVSGASKSGAPNVSSSCGRLAEFSRLWSCCSASAFSAASRTRNPWWAPAVYIARTWSRTAKLRFPVPEATVAGAPVTDGWFAQVTPPSVQLPFSRSACSVRPDAAE